MKAYVKLDKEDGLERFLGLAKDSTRKLVHINDTAQDEENIYVKAVAITRVLTVVGEGFLNRSDLRISVTEEEPESDIFARNGFIYVDKIEED